ncbi:protein phosphatase 2C domain-containing protein [uncultured Neptuniibacter sp.]|uniref:PP2C family protein-serine/threonine phosphatase n=1 Tax=uncultured Neptuniibacter sp. TaxID=502143 RepID=UPI0032B20B72|tara:strand:+ start:2048 stop:2788 length:741 start_codon:yes stop_codon:yes gene_type:complete
MTNQLTWRSASCTETGHVRKHNEDSLYACDQKGHWAVADGMGGHHAGDVASQLVVERLDQLPREGRLSQRVDLLEDTLIQTNQELVQMAGGGGKVIGTTVAGLMFDDSRYLIYWCGDSRVYLLRNGCLSQETVDHTLVQELLEQGRINPVDVENHPERNVITRAVGAGSELFIDMDLRPLQPGDLFLICSDGLDKEINEPELGKLLNQPYQDIDELLNRLMSVCLSRAAKDNITLALVSVEQTETS